MHSRRVDQSFVDGQQRLASSIAWKVALYRPPHQRNLQSNFHIMEDGEEDEGSIANFLEVAKMDNGSSAF